MQVELTNEERDAIIEALEGFISDLRAEIADTDRLEFRNMLKFKRESLDKLLAAVKSSE